ncbi:transposase [Nocardia sp. NPDC049526]|uniref:transposase n=1 Tax=Nocardia sp. NPDC049526 TaxID=3364316 RepID=UPI0037AD5505
MNSVTVAGRADLTDAQWARLEPLLPRNKKVGRPPQWTKRQIIDGIRWRTRVGCPWRDIPPQYGSWSAVYGLFRRWQRRGVWLVIVKLLQVISSRGHRLIAFGDAMQTPIQISHPHLTAAPDDDPAQSVNTAKWLLDELTAPYTLGFGLHFADVQLGSVTDIDGVSTWRPQ